MIPFWLQFIIVFLSMIGADLCWAKYFINVEKRNALKAASWSVAIIAMGIIP
jgi:hypothetical protein